ncbi:T3SS (YopN, CesT) and YbjN peptide-binding chaperone 1 [Nocardioides sp.]|uniref:T3SS (YopN, CesT) and YbjN peptide-binding chaperone 1 n=1 Tax=Nocardioides sp. TaxID=35761 RepID=UPI0039E45C6D
MGDFDWDGEVQQAWRRFRRRLADAVFDLGDGEEIYLAAPRADVHLRRGGDAIVVSRYGEAVEGGLSATETAAPRQCDQVAARVVTQLRGGGALHPALVVGESWQPVPTVPLPRAEDAEPELIRPETAEELRLAVGRALAPLLDGEIGRAGEGDLQITVGRSVLFVRVDSDCPRVDLLSELVWDVRRPERMADVVAELTGRHVYQFAASADRVLLRYPLPGWPFVPEQLRDVVASLLDGLDDLAADVAGRLDALRFRDEPRSAPATGPPSQTTGPVSPGPAEPRVGRERSEMFGDSSETS